MINWLDVIFYTVGGLGLFLYGMHTMSEGLKQASGEKVKNVLSNLTRNRVIALFIGMGVTMLVQSSSATTVLAVGLTNAGLLSLKQAVSVILGTNIGTTFTAWLVSAVGKFKISYYALPAIGVGFAMLSFSRRQKTKDIGKIIFGFGVLFLGLDIMKDAFGPIKKSEWLINMFASFSSNPLLGVLVGTVFTMLLQSSSATIAIVQLLAFNGVISFEAAVPVILGDNIGTTITAQLGAIGTNINAKRTAMAHSLFNVLGTVLILPFVWLGWYSALILKIYGGGNVMMAIAVAHSLFNVVSAVFFTIMLNPLVRLVEMITPDKGGEEDRQPQNLEEHLLDNPGIAMEQVVVELRRMSKLARSTVTMAAGALFQGDLKEANKVQAEEDLLNEFQKSITRYLVHISERHLATRESTEYPILLHSVNDLEKVGDYACNIAGYTEVMLEKKLEFPVAIAEHVKAMFLQLDGLFECVIMSLQKKHNDDALKAIGIEDAIDRMKIECRSMYIKAIKGNDGSPEALMMLMDIASNIEKMGDHLVSIAKAVLRDLQWGRTLPDNISELGSKTVVTAS